MSLTLPTQAQGHFKLPMYLSPVTVTMSTHLVSSLSFFLQTHMTSKSVYSLWIHLVIIFHAKLH